MKKNHLLNIELDYQRLAKARGNRSRAEVAEMLGFTPQFIGQIETGVRQPTPNTLLRLCFLYGLSLQDVAKGQEKFLLAS